MNYQHLKFVLKPEEIKLRLIVFGDNVYDIFDLVDLCIEKSVFHGDFCQGGLFGS